VQGRVVKVTPSGRVSGLANMSVRLFQAKAGNQAYTIYTDIVELSAEPERGKDAAKIAVGSAIGAAIGAIAGGGKGAAQGAAAGAGAGTGVVLATKGKEIQLAPETILNFQLGQPLTVRLTTSSGGEGPDPLHDLSIQQFNLGRDRTQTLAMWDIQIMNRSRTHAYREIRYVTNYYDAQGRLLGRNEGTMQVDVGPGQQRAIRINDGLYPVETRRYTIEIKGAQAIQ